MRLFLEAWENKDFEKALQHQHGFKAELLDRASNGEPSALFILGSFYEDGLLALFVGGTGTAEDRPKAIGLYTLAARLGNADARLRLTFLGAPVPPADLVKKDNSGEAAALMLLGLGLMSGGQQRAVPSPTINCETTRYGNRSQTSCQ